MSLSTTGPNYLQIKDPIKENISVDVTLISSDSDMIIYSIITKQTNDLLLKFDKDIVKINC